MQSESVGEDVAALMDRLREIQLVDPTGSIGFATDMQPTLPCGKGETVTQGSLYPAAIRRVHAAINSAITPTVCTFKQDPSTGSYAVWNLVVSAYPMLKPVWRGLLKNAMGVPAITLPQLGDLLTILARHCEGQLRYHHIEVTPENMAALPNLYMARAKRQLGYPINYVPLAVWDWLGAGVAVDTILYFFAPNAGGFDQQTRQPLVTLDEALTLSSVPLEVLMSLYQSTS